MKKKNWHTDYDNDDDYEIADFELPESDEEELYYF